MSENDARRNVRKGTKSCAECRRRKVRCVRVPEDGSTCRQCEERGSECTAQIFSNSNGFKAPRVSSRYRISQLESKVGRLSKVVHDLELKLGYLPTGLAELNESESSEEDESDDAGSSVIEIPSAEQPAHLRALFQNNWLSVDNSQDPGRIHERKGKTEAFLLENARHKLQNLMPPKAEIMKISKDSFTWLSLLQSLLPQPFSFNSKEQLLESYDAICQPDANVMVLATWLLTLAITAQQDIQEYGNHNKRSKDPKYPTFSRAVSDVTEDTIIRHDKLIGTVQGLGLTLHFTRVQLSLGYFQKAWIWLRHIITLGELIGLHKTFRAVEIQISNGIRPDESHYQRAQLWESIYLVDRIFGMIINLPPGTRQYLQIPTSELMINGVVQPKFYFKKLANICVKLLDGDDIVRSKAESYAIAMKADKELKEIASQIPQEWWKTNKDCLKADDIMQYLHFCVIMRLHFPYALHQDSGENHEYSRISCFEACETVLDRFIILSQLIPPGVFVSQFIILQAFACAIVLLLLTQDISTALRMTTSNDELRIQSVVQRVIDIMEERSKPKSGSRLTEHAFKTIRSLQKLLQQDQGSSQPSQGLTLKVPLLGTIRIRRNEAMEENALTSQTYSQSELPKPNTRGMTRQEQSPFGGYVQTRPSFHLQGEWEWDPISWSNEEPALDSLQNELVMGDFDSFNFWQTGTGNLAPVSSKYR